MGGPGRPPCWRTLEESHNLTEGLGKGTAREEEDEHLHLLGGRAHLDAALGA